MLPNYKMKNQTLIFLFCFLASLIKSQKIEFNGEIPMRFFSFSGETLDKSQQNIYYEFSFIKRSKSKIQTICILELGKSKSKFSDLNSIKSDSLTKIYNTQKRVTNEEFNKLFQMRGKWNNVLIKDRDNKTIIVQDRVLNAYQYDEKQPDFNWKLETETKIILGYNCNRATTQYRGRKYVAWYTTEIPISNGPYVFEGLPGLIMEIEDSKDEFHFKAVAMDKIPREIYRRNDKEIRIVTREQFRKLAKDYHENPGYYLGETYDAAGNQIRDRGKSIPYNPIEKE